MGESIERRFLIVAGEASGDHHAAGVVRCLTEGVRCRIRGVAGPALAAAGVETVVPMSELAVLGFSGVVSRLPRLLAAYRRLLEEAERFRPDAAILVDSPGFNLRFGPDLKRRGIKVFYYIAPQVWAWRPERARAMSRWVDRLAVVFPFEEPLFRAAGVPTEFVGHPLLDELEPEVDEASLRAELGAGAADRILGLLPGSRAQEVRSHLPVMLESAARLARTRPDLRIVVPIAPGLEPGEVERVAAPHLAGVEPRVRFLTGRTRAVEAFATACAVASGTASLETALFGTPLVVVYRTSWLNYEIARRLVRLERIALPNIVAGAPVADELIQDALTAPRLESRLAPLLDVAEAREAARRGLAVVRERLGTPGAASRTAALVEELVA